MVTNDNKINYFATSSTVSNTFIPSLALNSKYIALFSY